MKKLHAVLLLAMMCASTGFAASAPEAEGPVIALPPFRVDEFSNYLGFTWNAVLEKDKISVLRFSRVELNSLASRAGLLAEDRLLAIDDHSVAGISIEELQRLFGRNWKPGDTLAWKFTVERGLFNSHRDITLKMRTKPADPDAAETKQPATDAKTPVDAKPAK